MQQLEAIIKRIRSKGVGLFFITQNPADLPDSVLSQLGLKVQHALRAFTARDRKAIRLAAENDPFTSWYETETLLTALGIGEALVSVLNEKGIPTPLVHTLMRAPASRMDILTPAEIDRLVAHSALAAEYNPSIDRESAYEILTEKIQAAQQRAEPEDAAPPRARGKAEPARDPNANPSKPGGSERTRMPSVPIEVRKQSPDQEIALMAAVHTALCEAFRIKTSDRNVRRMVHAPHRFACPPDREHPERYTQSASMPSPAARSTPNAHSIGRSSMAWRRWAFPKTVSKSCSAKSRARTGEYGAGRPTAMSIWVSRWTCKRLGATGALEADRHARPLSQGPDSRRQADERA